MKLLLLFALSLAVAGVPVAGAQTAAAGAAAATYRVDTAHSTIVYAMHHPAHDWTGTSHAVTGALTVTPAGAITAASVTAPVTSFDSGNRSRDSHMVEATEAYVYRTVAFRLTRLTPLAHPTPEANATAEGTMTFHGVRQALQIPVRVERAAGGALRLRGTFDVTLTQFGISPPRLLGIATQDWIGLTVDLTARPT